MPIFLGSSDSEDERAIHKTTKFFTRQRSIHSIFGGGKGIYIYLSFPSFVSVHSLCVYVCEDTCLVVHKHEI